MQVTLAFLLAGIAATAVGMPQGYGADQDAQDGYAATPSYGLEPEPSYTGADSGYGAAQGAPTDGYASSAEPLDRRAPHYPWVFPTHRNGSSHGAFTGGFREICDGYDSLTPAFEHSYRYLDTCTQQEAYEQLSQLHDDCAGVVGQYQECHACDYATGGNEYDEYKQRLSTIALHLHRVISKVRRRWANQTQFFTPAFRRFSDDISIIIQLAGLLHVDVHALFLSLNIDLNLWAQVGIQVDGLIGLGVGVQISL